MMMEDDHSDAPAVSVVMPVYNCRRYLRQSVESILAQTFTDFELIAVDDGSTDGSLDILRECEGLDRRIRVLSRPNTGISGARNDGLHAARANLIASMDADDVSFPERLKLQVAHMQAHPECVALGGAVEVVDPYGNRLYVEHPETEHSAIEERLFQGDGSALRQPAAMLRRDAVLGVGGYAMEYSGTEDLDLFLRLVDVGKVANLPELLVQYRQHLSSTNHLRWREQEAHRHACVTAAYRRRYGSASEPIALSAYSMPSSAQRCLSWGWAMLKSGKRWRAMHYAMKAYAHGRRDLEALRLFACAVRGR